MKGNEMTSQTFLIRALQQEDPLVDCEPSSSDSEKKDMNILFEQEENRRLRSRRRLGYNLYLD